MNKIAPYAKAITGAIVAGLGALGVSLTPDESGLVSVNAGEWVAVAIATLVASYAVWQIPNGETVAEAEGDAYVDGHQTELDF